MARVHVLEALAGFHVPDAQAVVAGCRVGAGVKRSGEEDAALVWEATKGHSGGGGGGRAEGLAPTPPVAPPFGCA